MNIPFKCHLHIDLSDINGTSRINNICTDKFQVTSFVFIYCTFVCSSLILSGFYLICRNLNNIMLFDGFPCVRYYALMYTINPIRYACPISS